MMVISQKMLTVLKKTIPKLAFILLMAYHIEQSQILGFIFLEITGKLSEGFVANIGLTTREGVRGMGIGSIVHKNVCAHNRIRKGNRNKKIQNHDFRR